MADKEGMSSEKGRTRQGTSIRIVAGRDAVAGSAIQAPPTLTRSERELVETLFEWGVEPWEIALATRQSEAVVDGALGGPRPIRPTRPHRARAAWVDDFLIFLHARLADLPNWWEATGNPLATTAHLVASPKRKRARETRAP